MTLKTNARLAGFMFLFYILTGVSGMILAGQVGGGPEAASKLAAIAQHETIVRTGAVFGLLEMLDAFVLAVALYAITRAYDRDLALLALICRFAEGMVSVFGIFSKRALLAAATTAAKATGAEAVAATVLGGVILKMQGLAALIGASAFAVGSIIFAYLFLRARTIPAWLSWLGIIASLMLVIALPLQLAGAIQGLVTSVVWIPMAVFEVTIAVWLLVKGVAPEAVTS